MNFIQSIIRRTFFFLVALLVFEGATSEAAGRSAPAEKTLVLLSDDFDSYEAGVLVGQGGWAPSEDLEEATKQAEVTRPGHGGSGGALFLRERGQGASKALSRPVGEETIVVEFDFLPGTLQRPLTLGLRAGPVGDHVRGSVSAHLKLDGGKCFLLRKPPAKWTPFEGVGWEVGKRVHVRLVVDYAANLARIEVDGVRSPTAIGDWWTQAKPANIDITAQFGGGGSTLDNLVVTALAGGASKLPQHGAKHRTTIFGHDPDNGDETFSNPVVFGNWTCPSILRDGDFYYSAGTSQGFQPGCPIIRSRDLLHWEYVGHVFQAHPDIVSGETGKRTASGGIDIGYLTGGKNRLKLLPDGKN